jgi:hypothetical protein
MTQPQTIRLVFFRSKSRIYARMLRWMTGGNVSHVGFLMSDNDTVASQRETFELESLSIDLKGRKHFILDLPKGVIVKEDDLRFLAEIDDNQLINYGWMDYVWFLPRKLFGSKIVNWPGYICSEICWAIMFTGGWDLVLEVPSPHSLLQAVMDHG